MAPLTHLLVFNDSWAAHSLLALCLSQSLIYFTRLLLALRSIYYTLQHKDDAFRDTFGWLLYGGVTELATNTYHKRVARMQLDPPCVAYRL